MATHPAKQSALIKTIFNKVPEITIFFWIIKILCTTVGETAADFLNFNLNFGLTITTYVMSVLLLAALVAQVALKRYIAASYWIVVVFVSVVGTLITDNLSDNLKVPLLTSTIAFSVILAGVFAIWYWSEKTLSIHSIRTRKRELFYWAAILFTFALGTAVGDLVAEQFNVGYLLSAVLFGAIIAAITFAYYKLKLNSVFAFWAAYILTRPFGASMGDLLSQPHDAGGLALGTVGTSALFLGLIVAFVLYLTRTRKDVAPEVAKKS